LLRSACYRPPSKHLQIRVDSPTGPIAGTLVIPANTADSVGAQTVTAAITGLSGVHSFYLVLVDAPAGGELDTFSFIPTAASATAATKT